MNEPKRLYRANDGLLLGVCLGLSRYFDFPVAIVRFLVIVAVFCSALLPGLGLYLLAALLMEKEPSRPVQNEEEGRFYERCRQSRTGAREEVKKRLQDLDGRLRDLEDQVTRNGYDWDRRFRSGQKSR